jgi:hypothetical protein
MPIYEYLTVMGINSSNLATIRNLPVSDRPPMKFTTTYYVWRPGATEAEERREDLGLLVVFNEVGQDGWKLVASDIVDSRVTAGGNYYGWTSEIGVPVRQRWVFMREVGS